VERKVNKLLLDLCGLDSQIFSHDQRRKEIQKRSYALSVELERRRGLLRQCQEDLDASLARSSQEHARLKSEEDRITDRRKQLSNISGAKAAKIIEKEIEISSRSLEILGESSREAEALVRRASAKMEQIQAACDALQDRVQSESPEQEVELKSTTKSLSQLSNKRIALVDNISNINSRVMPLYDKIARRYPDGAVAVASDGSCRSCFRALPSQLYNQILAGNIMLQCPGCSRMIIKGE